MHTAIKADHTLRSLALSVARNNVGAMRPVQEIYASSGLSQLECSEIALNPQFLRYVDSYTTELKDSGFSFSSKSRILAEDLLPTAYSMAKDIDIPAAVRQKIIENLVEWGDLKPKNTTGMGGGPGFSITINLPGTNGEGAKTLILEGISTRTDEDSYESYENQLKIPTFTLSEPADYEYAGDDYL
jgi:hypothetical protein